MRRILHVVSKHLISSQYPHHGVDIAKYTNSVKQEHQQPEIAHAMDDEIYCGCRAQCIDISMPFPVSTDEG